MFLLVVILINEWEDLGINYREEIVVHWTDPHHVLGKFIDFGSVFWTKWVHVLV